MQDISIILWPSARRGLLARLLRVCIGADWDKAIEAGRQLDEAAPEAEQALAKTERKPQPGRRYLVEYDDYVQGLILRYEEMVARGAEDNLVMFRLFASADFSRYARFRASWVEAEAMQDQIVVHTADLRADPMPWLEWAYGLLQPGQVLTPLMRARANRAAADWLAANPPADLAEFRYYDTTLFSWLAHLSLPRELVQTGFREMLGRDIAEADMIAFQTLPSYEALQDHLMGTPEYRAAQSQPPAVPASEVAAAYRLFLDRAPRAAAPPRYSSAGQMFDALARAPEFTSKPWGRKTPLAWPLSQVFVSPQAKVMYCPIGKNACTFLKSQMLRISDIRCSEIVLENIHVATDLVATGLQLSDYPPEAIDAMIADPAYLKFAVLRDPFERLLSAYIEKFVLGRNDAANIHHTRSIVDLVYLEQGQHLGQSAPDYQRGISFAQFVDMVTRLPAATLDPHWRPQHLYLAGLNYDRIYRFDEIGQVVDLLESRSGKSLPRQPRNVTGSGEGVPVSGASDLLPQALAAQPRIHRSSFLTPEIAHAIRNYFKDDYAILDKLTLGSA